MQMLVAEGELMKLIQVWMRMELQSCLQINNKVLWNQCWPTIAKSRYIWQHCPYKSDFWKWMEFFYFCRCCFERWPCQTYHHDVSMCWLYVLELSHWWIASTSCSSASRNGMRIWNARHVLGSIIIKPHTLLYYLHQRRSQGAWNFPPPIHQGSSSKETKVMKNCIPLAPHPISYDYAPALTICDLKYFEEIMQS